MTVRVVGMTRGERATVKRVNKMLRRPFWPGFLWFIGALITGTALAYLFLFVVK